MNNFLKVLIKFLFFSCGVYIAGIIIFGTMVSWQGFRKNLIYEITSYGFTYTRLQEVKKMKDIDILFLGASHSYRGFDTRFYDAKGMHTFNLGSSNQSHIQTRYLLKKHLKNLNPKLIVYDVYPFMLEIDGVESSIDIIANDQLDIYSIELVYSSFNIKVLNTFIFSLFKQFFSFTSDIVEPLLKHDDQYISGGYVEQAMRYNNDKTQIQRKKWSIDKQQMKAFKENISIFHNYKIPFILVQIPTVSDLYNSYENNDEMDELFSSLGSYYNLNKMIDLSDSLDFYDDHHLNQVGVKKMNNKILEIINNALAD